MNPRLIHFSAGATGLWSIHDIRSIIGPSLAVAPRLDVTAAPLAGSANWVLRGVTSNSRYTTKDEKDVLNSKQQGLGRDASSYAALIPIKKNAAWWLLSQDERRAIFEEQSKHNTIGMKYLPSIARRLHHCRDLSTDEPFDFITWFEFSPGDESAFDSLLAELRASLEWQYVEREVDIRLRK
jgi:hypothetical protein